MTAQEILYIFKRATATLSDADFVQIHTHQALTAFGAEAFEREFGVGISEVNSAVDTARENHLKALDAEIKTLKDLAAAGVSSAQQDLKKTLQERRKILDGRLRPKPVVRVNVGVLRRLMDGAAVPVTASLTDAPVTDEPDEPGDTETPPADPNAPVATPVRRAVRGR